MKKIIIITLLLSLCGCTHTEPKTYHDPYNREKAVAYANEYALNRNDEYANLDDNCTNFVSQVLIAGGKQMDTPIPPTADERINYYSDKDLWFSTSMHSNKNKWKEFSVSTSFIRTSSFIEYWCNYRGMKLTTYHNTLDGLINIKENASIGDVLILYNKNNEIAHLSIITYIDDVTILVCANTNDVKDKNILELSKSKYPRVGLLHIQ